MTTNDKSISLIFSFYSTTNEGWKNNWSFRQTSNHISFIGKIVIIEKLSFHSMLMIIHIWEYLINLETEQSSFQCETYRMKYYILIISSNKFLLSTNWMLMILIYSSTLNSFFPLINMKLNDSISYLNFLRSILTALK